MVIWQVVLWVLLTAAFLVTEVYTVRLFAVWFGIGSFLAFLSALFNTPFYLQAAMFLTGSVVCLVIGTLFIRRYLKKKAG